MIIYSVQCMGRPNVLTYVIHLNNLRQSVLPCLDACAALLAIFPVILVQHWCPIIVTVKAWKVTFRFLSGNVKNNSIIYLSWQFFKRCLRHCKPIPVFLPGESQRQRSLVGCRLWGRTVRHNWSDSAAAAAAAAAARHCKHAILFLIIKV